MFFLCRNLALLPRDKIDAGWEYIEHAFNDYQHLAPFLQYFKKYWLSRETVDLWSVFGERHRTNNYVESFHTSLSKKIKKFNRNLLDLIAAFKKDAGSKRTAKKRRSCFETNDKFMCDAQLQLLNGYVTVGHFLEMVR